MKKFYMTPAAENFVVENASPIAASGDVDPTKQNPYEGGDAKPTFDDWSEDI